MLLFHLKSYFSTLPHSSGYHPVLKLHISTKPISICCVLSALPCSAMQCECTNSQLQNNLFSQPTIAGFLYFLKVGILLNYEIKMGNKTNLLDNRIVLWSAKAINIKSSYACLFNLPLLQLKHTCEYFEISHKSAPLQVICYFERTV